jgi:hypothetical protein
MAVISVTVVLGNQPVTFRPETLGAVIAILPLGGDRTVQLVATYDQTGEISKLVEDTFRRATIQSGGPQALPGRGVFFVHGNRGNDIPWVTAVRFRRNEANDEVL